MTNDHDLHEIFCTIERVGTGHCHIEYSVSITREGKKPNEKANTDNATDTNAFVW